MTSSGREVEGTTILAHFQNGYLPIIHNGNFVCFLLEECWDLLEIWAWNFDECMKVRNY